MLPTSEKLYESLLDAEKALLSAVPHLPPGAVSDACVKQLMEIRKVLVTVQPKEFTGNFNPLRPLNFEKDFKQKIRPAFENAFDYLDDRLASSSSLKSYDKNALLLSHSFLKVAQTNIDLAPERLVGMINQAHNIINENWATPNSPEGRRAVAMDNDLRVVLTYLQYGMDAVGGKLPKRRDPIYEMYRTKDNHFDSAYYTRSHALNAMDVMDEKAPLTYHVLDTCTGQRHLSFAAKTELIIRGLSPDEYFADIDKEAIPRERHNG